MPITTQRVVLTSFVVDLLDVGLNLAVMIVTGSVIMLAELVQGLSDLLASGFLLVGLRRPKREVARWTLASALCMLLIASTFSFAFGLERFLFPHPIKHIALAYIGLGIGTISNGYALVISVQQMLGKRPPNRAFLKKFDASPLIMTKNTLILDLMGMSAAVVGLIALIFYQLFGDLRFDGLGAMGIGIVLGFLSLRLVRNLLD